MRADLDGLLIGVQDTLGPLFAPPDDHEPWRLGERKNQGRFGMAFISTTHYSHGLPEIT
jgi:hypothetical protein